MEMTLNSFMSKFSALLVQMVQKEVGMLLGVPGEIEELQRTVGDIQCVIADAEMKQIQSMTIKRWLMELKDVMYDADDIMDLCKIKAKERREHSDSTSSSKIGCGILHLLSCFRNPVFAHEIGTKIKEINSRLEEISRRKTYLGLNAIQTVVERQPVHRVESVISRMTDSLVVMEDLVGEKIAEDANRLVSWLTEEESSVRGNLGVVAIVGMGGIGKTTLAKRIFNDSKIKEEFKLTIWACVSKEPNRTELLKSIIRKAGGDPGAALESAELVPQLEEAIRKKRFFLVLDDVWPESVEVWDELLRALMSAGAHGSKLLVTTRDDRVANILQATKTHRVQKMSDEDGWHLLIKQVFRIEKESEIQDFKTTGLELVQKCDGLPLAIKSVGGVLRTKSRTLEEWKAVLRSKVWSLNELPTNIYQAFYLSYEDLPSPIRDCFIFCSLYPEDYIMNKTDLIYLWYVEGFLRNTDPWELGKEYYNQLLIRNLLEVSVEMYDNSHSKMHDVLRSFAHYLGKDENYILTEEDVLDRQGCSVKLRRLSIQGNKVNIEAVKKEKGLRTLIIDHISENTLADLCRNLPNLRVLDMSVSSISVVPNSLSSLMHLRYLDVSNSKVTIIPESIGCLKTLLYLDFTNCTELQRVPDTITNLKKLMFLSFQGTKVEGIPPGLKCLKKLRELSGFRLNDNSLKMFSSLDELETLSHLVHLKIECLERVTDKSIAKKAKLLQKNQLQNLHLRYTEPYLEDQQFQVNEKKVTTESVLNELCPPSSLELLVIKGYLGSCLPNWLNLGTTLSNLRYLDIKNCNFFVKLSSLGQLPNLDFLRIEGANSIVSVGEEFLWGDIKRRDIVAESCTYNPAFPKLNKLIFKEMHNWKNWQWNKGVSAMSKLKELYIEDCPQLTTLPEGLVHHSTSLEYLQIIKVNNLTAVENFPSVNEIRAFENPNLKRMSNLPRISAIVIDHCQNLTTMEKLNALQRMKLLDSRMERLPEYLLAVTPEKLKIDCSEELLRKITSEGVSGSERKKFQHIPKVTIYSWDDSLHATYQWTPFSFTTNVTSEHD